MMNWKMSSKDRKIAKAIILAQIASDGGKGNPSLRHLFKEGWVVNNAGYSLKDAYILKAIYGINKSRNSMFRYYVAKGDIGGSWLVYFNFLVKGEKMQVSFHAFSKEIARWVSKKSNPHYSTGWDGILGGSQNSCLYLRELMKDANCSLYDYNYK